MERASKGERSCCFLTEVASRPLGRRIGYANPRSVQTMTPWVIGVNVTNLVIMGDGNDQVK